MKLFAAKRFNVKLMGMSARIALVSFSCFFLSSSALLSGAFTGSEPQKSPESATPVVLDREVDIAKSEGAAKAETLVPVKKDSRSVKPAKKGVIYLPVVSLSSYLPIAAQILLMILVISLSGLFGAWLMFRTLAKKVLSVEEANAKRVQAQQEVSVVVAAPHAVPAPAPNMEPSIKEFFLSLDKSQQKVVAPVLAQSPEGKKILRTAQAEIYRSRVEKRRRTLVLGSEKRKGTNSGKTTVNESASMTRTAATPATQAMSVGTKSKRIPSRFLINDWFPLDH